MYNLLAPFNSSGLSALAQNHEQKSKCANVAPESIYLSQWGRANVKIINHVIPEIGGELLKVITQTEHSVYISLCE